MAKHKKRGHKWFLIGMVIYAIVFLAVTAVGLSYFWDFIDAYEQSRPQNTVNTYLEQLTQEDMCNGAWELLSQIDHHIQSEEECFRIIRDSMTEEITCAKKTSACTDIRQVYVLRCGEQVIGQFAISTEETDKYGFAQWSVTEESFDFSHLMGEAVSVTVPQEFTVSFNGKVLDSGYITESGIPYALLEEFYDDYLMPTMVTYTVDHFLGTASLEVKDTEGNLVSIGENMDRDAFLDNCTQAEKEQLETQITGFLQKYVKYTSSANGKVDENYKELRAYLVPGSALAQRLWSASDGLQWAQSKGDTIASLSIHHYVKLDGEHYLCDVTYLIDTVGIKGTVRTTNNMKVVLVQTNAGLRVETITSY